MLSDPKLFTPFQLGGMKLRNRAVMSPMLMYSAGPDGVANDLHLLHYGSRALGGVGLVMSEVVAVSPEGRISEADLGLWGDDQVPGIARIADAVHACNAKFGVQLAHAGRKSHIVETAVGPSAVPFGDAPDANVPRELWPDEIEAIVDAYSEAAARAAAAGADCLQIHAAHGYLLHEFLAPISNRRTDEYGSDLAGRAKLLRAVVRGVVAATPDHIPLLVRFSATDLQEGGVTQADALQLARWLEEDGVDFLELTTGNITASYEGEVYPGYQAALAAQVAESTNLPVGAVGSIHSPDLAEYLLRNAGLDLVFIGRALLRDPFWLIKAADSAGVTLELPIPAYARATGPFSRGF